MAWIEKRGGAVRLNFRFNGERFVHSCQSETLALELKHRVERRLVMIRHGDLTVPPNADFRLFVVHGTTTVSTPETPKPVLRFDKLVNEYFASMPKGAMEESSIKTAKIHFTHLKRILGAKQDVTLLTYTHLQKYVTARSGEAGSRGAVSPITIRKEIATLSALWGWLVKSELMNRPFPGKGLRYPKTTEKPPFQTREEIERKLIAKISDDEIAALWECLYLSIPQISEVLQQVKNLSHSTFLYPMLVLAAHTGARRSELLRSQIQDIDFRNLTLTLRERKRDKAQRTTRRVTMSHFVVETLKSWLGERISGSTFLHNGSPVTVNQASDHFRKSIDQTNWSVIRGWHVFRHSFISNCAARGIDQRIIDSWVGHQTDAMRRRYTHLFPSVQQAAMDSLFNESS